MFKKLKEKWKAWKKKRAIEKKLKKMREEDPFIYD